MNIWDSFWRWYPVASKTWVDVVQYVRCFFFFMFYFSFLFFFFLFFFLNLSFSYNHQLGTYVCICPLFSLVKTWREFKWVHVRCTYREVARDPHSKGRDYWALASKEIHKLVETYDRLAWRAKLAPAVWGRLSTNNAETWQVDLLVDHRIDHFINFGTLGASKVRVKYIPNSKAYTPYTK